MTSMTVAKGDYTYVTNTRFDDVELQDLTCPKVQPFTADSKKRKSIPSVVTARLASKIQGNSFQFSR